MRVTNLALFLALSVVAAAIPERAEAGFFSSPGTGCIVDPSQTTAQYTIINGRFTFSGTSVGQIVLNCPISFAITAPSTIELMYVDSNAGGSNYVFASYQKMNVNNGAFSGVSGVNSNSGTQSIFANNVTAGVFDTYDFNNFRYWVQVTLVRDSSTNTVSFLGVSLY